ncbi:hypothetical protein TUSST3_94170 [Streptomyces sp. TUS-ST3]|nr:hypothetical protein TUSST3_94170 [Streptomyces sp. TUS-ST3]
MVVPLVPVARLLMPVGPVLVSVVAVPAEAVLPLPVVFVPIEAVPRVPVGLVPFVVARRGAAVVVSGRPGVPCGRLSAGPVRVREPLSGEPGGRPSPGAVRGVLPPGTRGGVPPGRRESRRAGGRVPGWCWALVMTLFMGSPFCGPGEYRAVTSRWGSCTGPRAAAARKRRAGSGGRNVHLSG